MSQPATRPVSRRGRAVARIRALFDGAPLTEAEVSLWMRKLIVTVCAVLCAWSIGALFAGADALVAAILVLITLRVSLHASVNEAVGQLVGTAIGVGIAFTTLAVADSTEFAVAAAVLFALVSSRLLGLGEDGAINIAITSLIVLGPGNHEATAIDRVWGTFIGVAVAVVFSYWMHPSSPVGRTLETVTKLQADGADLLQRMSRQVALGYSLDDAAVWLHQARELVARIPAGREQAHEALRYAWWYPWARRDLAQASFERFVEAEHAAVQVRTIARTLLDVVEKGRHLPNTVRHDLAGALEAAAAILAQQARRVSEDPLATLPDTATDQVMARVAELGDELIELEDPGAVALTGAMAAAVERIADTIRGGSVAVTEVPHVEAEADTAVRLADAVTAPVRKVRRRRRP